MPGNTAFFHFSSLPKSYEARPELPHENAGEGRLLRQTMPGNVPTLRNIRFFAQAIVDGKRP